MQERIELRVRTRDGGEPARLRAAIRGLVRRFGVSERADVSCCGVTVAQAAALEALFGHGPMRLSDLGRRLGIAPSTLTRNLERLVEGGLVVRQADGRDARAARVRLTAAGRRAALGVADREEDFARQVLERIPEGPARRGGRIARRPAHGRARRDRGVLPGRVRPPDAGVRRGERVRAR